MVNFLLKGKDKKILYLFFIEFSYFLFFIKKNHFSKIKTVRQMSSIHTQQKIYYHLNII